MVKTKRGFSFSAGSEKSPVRESVGMSSIRKHRRLGTNDRFVRCIPLNPHTEINIKTERIIKMGAVMFIIGMMTGGTFGVFIMCLFQINKGEKDE